MTLTKVQAEGINLADTFAFSGTVSGAGLASPFPTNTASTSEGGANTTNICQGLAKAWVNFNGAASTVSTNDSFNVGSITDNGTGKYTVNISTAMGNTNYAVAAQTEDGGGYNDPRIINHEDSQSRSTTAYGLYHWHINNGVLDDATKLNVIVHGDLA